MPVKYLNNMSSVNESKEHSTSWKDNNRSSGSQETTRILSNPNVHHPIHKRPPPLSLS